MRASGLTRDFDLKNTEFEISRLSLKSYETNRIQYSLTNVQKFNSNICMCMLYAGLLRKQGSSASSTFDSWLGTAGRGNYNTINLDILLLMQLHNGGLGAGLVGHRVAANPPWWLGWRSPGSLYHPLF